MTNESEGKRVVVLLERQGSYSESVLRGIWRYASERGWMVRGAQPRMDSVERVVPWGADGVIAGLWIREVADRLAGLGVPVVDVYDWVEVPGLPRVGIDDVAVGREGAAFLRERGLRAFGFVGELNKPFARKRLEGFCAELARDGLTCAAYEGPILSSAWEIAEGTPRTDAPLGDFLRGLPKPAGVLAANDDVGLQVLDAARLAGLTVPDEVAVLGVDDDPLLCALAQPPMSSVSLRAERVGARAAAVLREMMVGGVGNVLGEGRNLLPPASVTARLSTDVLAVPDEDVVAALRWMRDHADRPVKVYDVLRSVPLSRRSLEIKFAKLLGRSPHEELTRVRVDRVKSLLVGTDLPMASVARRSGFPHAERMATVFRQETGRTPTEWRREFRGPGG